MEHFLNTDIAKEYGIEEAILLNNMLFWCITNFKNGVNIHRGRAWTYNSVKAYNELFDYMTPATIRRALDNLESNGLLMSDSFNTRPMDRTKWYALTDKAEKLLGKKASYCEMDVPQIEDDKAEAEKKETEYEIAQETKQPAEKPKRIPLTEREPKNDIERVEKAYLLNYRELYASGKVKTENPIINWSASRKLTSEVIKKIGADTVVIAVNKSKCNQFCIDSGYVLTTILSAKVLNGLLNDGRNKGSAVTRSGVNDVTKEDIDNIEF